VSVKFPTELDAEIERFIEETGIYTNKSEFIKEACRDHLKALNEDTAIAALRLKQLLAMAGQSQQRDSEIEAALRELAGKIDPEELERAIESARSDTAETVSETDV
jgi:Arc/MetJ-type ribon-helix-helix transcriptional regulator